MKRVRAWSCAVLLVCAGCAAAPVANAPLEAGKEPERALPERGVREPAPSASEPSSESADKAVAGAAERLRELQRRKSAPTSSPGAAVDGGNAADLMVRYEGVLRLAGTPEGRKPEILLRLAELAYREEEAGLRGAYESGTGAKSPALRFPKAISYYRRLVDGYPEASQALTAFYNLGYLYAEEGKGALSAWAYDQVLRRDAATPFADEIHMRLGEAAFDGDDLAAAIPHYLAVVERGSPEYADKALFKLGWSYYNQADYPRAVASFARVLERERPAPEDLRRETLQILSRCFVEGDGVVGVMGYLGAHPRGNGYGDRLYREVGDLYVGASKYEEAVKAYFTGVASFPLSPECLSLEKGLLSSLLVLRDLEGAAQRRETWAGRYGPGARWQQGKSVALVAEGEAMAEEGLRLSALYRHGEFQRGVGELGRALELYEKYFRLFPDDSDEGYELSYTYAQALKEGGKLAECQQRYRRVARDPKRSAHREEASYRRVDVLQVLERLDPSVFEELLGAHEEYAALNAGSALVAQVLFAEGELLFGRGAFERARGVFERVAQLDRADPLRSEALERAARCSFRAGLFSDAEARGRRALLAPLVADTAERARQLVEFSVFKQGEALESAGDWEGANRRFLQVADEFPREEAAAVALARVAENLRSGGKLQEAASVFQRLAASYPGSPPAKHALGAAADLLSALGQWGRAAQALEELGVAEAGGPLEAPARFRAGVAYENADDRQNAARVFAAFAARFRDDPRRAQALFRAGEALGSLSRLDEARESYRECWSATASGEEEVFRARAALALGDLAGGAFRKAGLAGNLEQALATKEGLLDEALARFAEAATFPYAETFTASFFKTGRLFEEMKDALLTSERPLELTPEEREQYDFLLEEKAAPLEERAVETYNKGTSAARKARVHTPWVERMFARLEALVPWAYQRTEERAGVWERPTLSIPREEAPEGFCTWLELRARRYRAAVHLGVFFLDDGKPADAAPVFEEVCREVPEFPEGWNGLGLARRAAGDYQGAEQAFGRSLEVSSGRFAPALKNLAILKEKYLALPSDAVPLYERYLAVRPGDTEVERWKKAAARLADGGGK